jgi:hypothetical protein
MNTDQLKELSSRFISYVDRFRIEGDLVPMHQLKLEHTIRVAADARAIAAGMGWAPEEVNLAEAVGLCHDVARFPQYLKYKSFSDATTVDHGDLGFQTLEDEGILAGLHEETKALIMHSVQYHNKKDLPRTLTAHEEKYLRLIRDADRLDIFFVCVDSLRNGTLQRHPELMMNIEFEGLPTPEVLDQFERGETIDYRYLNSMADRFVLQLSWMHDMSYTGTQRLICERNIIGQFVELLPVKTDRLLQCFETTSHFLEQAGSSE